ncbi:chemotaxis protein CheB [Actinoplanes sp. Pm04-4]|uniref:protein-glutamate methylesterase n=1 Tax=Paractinoplanes pyxinae TaxID=2997416 RepID=A0ABT4BEW8_9ACTN|nr:chemotaxis protein CheB [Actinoplanes pyxinae]MCY1145085.1 chemotaxis protein CheB [Actinoplanes pyxinae]
MTESGVDNLSAMEPVAVRLHAPSPDSFPVPFPVIALVASAGGVEALVRVLAPLPVDLPAVVLVALHQDPNRASQLAEILRRGTRLRVDVAADQMLMEPGHVLVVPPARHLLVTSEARIGLIPTGALPPARPSADLMLSTLAVTCGTRALAVILTGMGHDGQAGVHAIAHCGGTVLAQDVASSAFSAMPAAAAMTGRVHKVLSLDAIPEAILKHVS